MHWADINAALYKCGWAPSKVATELKVATTSVAHVIRGTRTSYNIASFIASVTGMPLRKLWPDGRYNEAPKRIRSAA